MKKVLSHQISRTDVLSSQHRLGIARLIDFVLSLNTTAPLKSGKMLRGGEADDHRRTGRKPGGERTGSPRQRSAGVSTAARTDRLPLSAGRGGKAGRLFPEKVAERGGAQERRATNGGGGRKGPAG